MGKSSQKRRRFQKSANGIHRLAASQMAVVEGGGIVTITKIEPITGIPGYEIRILGVLILKTDPIPT